MGAKLRAREPEKTVTNSMAVNPHTTKLAAEYSDVIFVTALCILQKYIYMGIQATSAAIDNKAHKRFGERIFLNYLEQGTMFLAALWMHALFMSPWAAGVLGYAYLV